MIGLPPVPAAGATATWATGGSASNVATDVTAPSATDHSAFWVSM